jgi:hypothetical protein
VTIRRLETLEDALTHPDSASFQGEQATWLCSPESRIEIQKHGEAGELVKRIVGHYPKVELVARASLGCQAYNRTKHSTEQIQKRAFHSDHKLGPDYLPELAGTDVSRYFFERRKGQWIKYGP